MTLKNIDIYQTKISNKFINKNMRKEIKFSLSKAILHN